MTDGQFTILVILPLTFLAVLLGSTLVRRRRTPLDLREIPAYTHLPTLVDESVESSRPAHFSLGTSAVGQTSTLTALAAVSLLYPLFKRLSFERRLPLVTLSDPITLAITADTLRKAYIYRDNLDAFRPDAVAWYPQGERSLTFAAGAAAYATDLDASSHILLGQFGAELAYIAEASRRREQTLVANATTLEGQAVAYVMADYSIVGEELFVSNAYLDTHHPLHMGGLIALDTLRWFVITLIVFSLIINALR